LGKSSLLFAYATVDRAVKADADPFAALTAAAQEEAKRRPFEGSWWDLFAQIADALAQRGIVAGSYDDCELWDVAAMLGANRAPEPETPADGQQGDMDAFRMM
jgi:hypothetical protein